MRDKIISIRVDSKLLEKVNDKIKLGTECHTYFDRRIYYYRDKKRNLCSKFSLSDLFAEKLKEFLDE